jgi:hypothetical protein
VIAAMVERARMRGDMVSARGLVGWLGRRCVVIAAMVERAWGASVVVLAQRGCRCVMCAAAFGRVCVGALRRGCRCVMCAAKFGRVMARSVVVLARLGCRCVMFAAAFGRVCVGVRVGRRFGAIRRGCRCVMCAAKFGRVWARSVVVLARWGVPRGVAAGQPPVGRLGAAGNGGRVGAAIVARVAGDGCGVERALSRRRA